MTDCGCTKARSELEEYLRNEVCTSASAADIREHLESCESCRDEAHVAKTLTDAVARACKEAAPEQLRASVLASLRQAQADAHAK